jgi:Spy/CpxP family protein refolding chaperone
MRKIQLGLVAAMLVASTSVAAAQDQPARQQGRGNQMAMLLQGITLTADQQVKVDSINKKYDEQRQALRSETDMEVRRTKSRELTTKQLEEIKPLLTDEQKKALEKNQADMAARMQGGGRPPQR